MNTKQRLYPSISLGTKTFAFLLLMLVTACGVQEDLDVEKEDRLQLSDQEITLGVDGWKPMEQSRATIFENLADVQNDAVDGKGGGYFTMHAYLRETGYHFIPGARAWYFDGNWRFFDEANNRFPQYFWPQNNVVDFFAYMPWSGSNKNKHLKEIEYTQGVGLTINCEMQSTTSLEDTDGQETIIAYTMGKRKENKSVNMYFVHPFSAVYFKLKQAHRNLTINWIRFNNIYLKGSTTLNATTDAETIISWIPPVGESESTFKIQVGKTIPDDINFGGNIGGPYLVMPQSFGKNTDTTDDDVTITINYTWDDGTDQDKTNDTKEFTRSITTNNITNWIAGNKYTYILDLGDNKEEILFQVQVEPWVLGGVKNEIDVE